MADVSDTARGYTPVMRLPEVRGVQAGLDLTEHPEGHRVACPWEGVTVHATIHPRATMSFADRERRAPSWPERRRLIEDYRRQLGAVQLDVFGGKR